MTAPADILPDLAIGLLLFVAIGIFRSPARARAGNALAALAVAAAVAIVSLEVRRGQIWIAAPAGALGALAGWIGAVRVSMVGIPALIALQNGAGGLAACLVSIAELAGIESAGLPPVAEAAGLLGIAVGGATASGSFLATGKLARWIPGAPWSPPRPGLVLLALGVGVGVSGGAAFLVTATAPRIAILLALACLSMALGAVFAGRLGGADMPVLISLLNSLTGLAAALCGLVVGNRLLIACGAIVAASGWVLTGAMCRAMNRGVVALFAGSGAAPRAASVERLPESRADDTAVGRAAEILREATRVLIVPGYGMALADAQGEVARLADSLLALKKDVRFAVHPLAGRMPGHMHVLLAEAEVDYDKIFELDRANPLFPETDAVLVVGACDVVNPAAATVPGTPISGMPILKVHEARHVVVCNLDREPGYSGVRNPLYDLPATILLLGDAATSVREIVRALEGAESPPGR